MATIRKKGRGWQVIIRRSDGHPPVYRSGFDTKQEAKDWAVEEEARRRQANYFPDQSLKKYTLTQTIDDYIENSLPKKESSSDILRHLNWWKEKLGGYALRCITPNLIAQYRKELADGLTPKGTKRSNATVNRYMASLSSVFTFAVKELGYINANPMLRRISKLKESRGRDRILNTDEFKRLLDACSQSKNPFLLTVVMIAVSTGMRQGEILNLTWDDIDLKQKLISLKKTKNGHPRSVPITQAIAKQLEALLQYRSPQTSFVFPSRKRFGKISIRKAWETALLRAGIQDYRLHDLRHQFATHAAKAGASNLALQTAMGHRTLEVLCRYTNMDVEHTRHLSDAVSNELLDTWEASHGT